MSNEQRPVDRDPGRCPPDEVLATWVDLRVSASQRARLLAHVARCPRCRALVGEVAEARRGCRTNGDSARMRTGL